MGCQRSLALNLASGGDMPLSDAVAAAGKIYGMMSNYIVQFNATTGAKEAIARVTAPILGPCRICYHAATGLLYVSCWFDPAWDDQINDKGSPNSDIFPVNPASLAIGAAIGIEAAFPGSSMGPKLGISGPWFLMSDGNYLYFSYRQQGAGGKLYRINPANLADKASATNWRWLNWNAHSFDINGTQIYWPDPNRDIWWGNKDFTGLAANPLPVFTTTETPIALAVSAANIAWTVCGNQWLLRANMVGPTYTAINLEDGSVVTNAVSNVRPFRIRYFNSLLYIAVQNQDGVIIYNPTGNAPGAATPGIFKSGFDGPVDTCWTGSKAFAVQSGPVSLKEIT